MIAQSIDTVNKLTELVHSCDKILKESIDIQCTCAGSVNIGLTNSRSKSYSKRVVIWHLCHFKFIIFHL